MNSSFMGIDVSKGYGDFLILNVNSQLIEPNFQLDDTFEGHHKLYEILKSFFQRDPDATLFCGIESTGGYENNWVNSLVKLQEQFNLKVARLNPAGVKYSGQANLNRVTTDKISAETIAKYLIKYPEKISFEHPENDYASLKRQWKLTKLLTKQRTQLLNSLEKMLYSAFPEILTYCKNKTPQWVLKLLETFPTAKAVALANVEALIKIQYVSVKKAEKLIKKAQQSVASSDDAITADLIMTTIGQINSLTNLIALQRKKMQSQIKPKLVKQLESFIGIGTDSAVGLAMNFEPFERFPHSKKFCAFFGVHPVFKSSGDGVSAMRMSKKGNPEVRAILYMVAKTAYRHNPLICDVYTKHIQKGKKHAAVMGICMHKILRILYGMMKNRRDFDPDIDRKNQQKEQLIKPGAPNGKARRFQQPQLDAPISRKQSKKRKEQKLSQSDNITQNGIEAPAHEPNICSLNSISKNKK